MLDTITMFLFCPTSDPTWAAPVAWEFVHAQSRCQMDGELDEDDMLDGGEDHDEEKLAEQEAILVEEAGECMLAMARVSNSGSHRKR